MATNEPLLLGQILVERRVVDEATVQRSRELQDREVASGSRRRQLGDILVDQGIISAADRDSALNEQRKHIAATSIGPYRIIDKLGQGGMGAVYRAHIPDSHIDVALKLLPKKLASDPNYLARFRREALIGISMNHPAIVRTVDFGEHRGTFYLAMEIIEGGTLDDLLYKQHRLSENEAMNLAYDMLDALDYAHQLGLVHRDIKPSNILFDLNRKPKLSDFGLAKDSSPDPSFMTAGLTVGTPHYMAPEQALGLPNIDIRADLYSLGATLYHSLTGRTPYDGSSAQLLASRFHYVPVHSPRHYNKDLSAGASAIIARLMARQRHDRYSDPCHARADVELLLNGETPLALSSPESNNSGFNRAMIGSNGHLLQKHSKESPAPRTKSLKVMTLLIVVAVTGIVLGAFCAFLFLR